MHVDPKAASLEPALLSVAQTNGLNDPPFTPQDDDSIERITVLGTQAPNPYLIANMQQAYRNLGYNPNMATVTNLYVRFKPTTDQISVLDSVMDAQGLELFDSPMDYNVTYEGDYYQDPSIPDSLPTWQYAVVLPNFVFPSGIVHETLAQIHIPTDAYTAIETEAENIAGGGVMQNSSSGSSPNTVCLDGHHIDPVTGRCVPDNCPDGYHWNGTTCVPMPCPSGYYFNGSSCVPYRTTPPAPAPDAAIPTGGIFVHDTNLGSGTGLDVGVRNTRVVARRWFKIERTYTDNSGHFVFTKKFKHKVRVLVKFKNDFASVRGMRGLRLWQMLFPVKKTLGIFSGDKSNILYIAKLTQTIVNIFGNQLDVTTSNKSTRYWAAATTINSVQEYRDYASAEQIGLPSTGIKIILSNWGHGSGATPMFAKRASNDLPAEFVTWFMAPPAPIISSVIFTLKHQVDIVGSYNFGGFSDITSDAMKELFYHELTHCAHYQALGNSWYTNFVNAEIYEIVNSIFSGNAPYGAGTNSQSAVVALGEGWAYHIGHFFTDKMDGILHCSNLHDNGQAADYSNGSPTAGLSSHLNLLENFNPNSATDHFKWIPTGLFYDLFDNTPN
ncbi:MAG: hypothetical protein ABI091_01900 [Ferruginibacter sp.]